MDKNHIYLVYVFFTRTSLLIIVLESFPFT